MAGQVPDLDRRIVERLVDTVGQAPRPRPQEGSLHRRVGRLGAHPGRAAGPTLDDEAITRTLGAVLKHASDTERAVKELGLGS